MYPNYNLTLNFTASDTHLDSCWYEYNNTNTTISCVNNTLNNIPFNYQKDQNSLIVFVNDTYGNLASKIESWDYKLFRNSVSYTSSSLSGGTTIFILNTTINPSYTLLYSYFYYGNNSKMATLTNSLNDYILNVSFTSPTVLNSTNYSFYWNSSFSDGTLVMTNLYNQTINPFLIGNCITYTHPIFNFTLYDQKTQIKLTNTTTKFLFHLFNSNRAFSISNYSGSSISNPLSICSNVIIPSPIVYSLDAILKYTSNESSYDIQYYNIINYLISNTSLIESISLYPLLMTDETDFSLTDRKSTRLNSSHTDISRMPSSA